MKKAGLIRCLQTEDYCAATTCLANAKSGQGGFAEVGPVEVVALSTCGGCPGKKAVHRAQQMKKGGAELIVLASCILKGTPSSISFPCPFGNRIKQLIGEKTGLPVVEWTH
ncbi:MAG TPA: CGGC domain-containing protein [Chroococcales cyanobacterium]|jgi:predicted metal-binding protein